MKAASLLSLAFSLLPQAALAAGSFAQFMVNGAGAGGGGGGGDTPFTPVHLYYMNFATGSDANNGTSPASAWKTPAGHSISCGDVIVAAPGNDSNTWGSGDTMFGAVSNCPSTTGGIDGTGGIYFAILLCAGSDLGSNGCSHTVGSPRIATTTSNWAWEGWTENSGGTARAFENHACAGVVSYVAVINSVSINNLQAFDTDDCGASGGPNTVGGDYSAAVGLIAQNSAQDPICLAAIDIVGPGQLDTNAGTHHYVNGSFSYANHNPSCTSLYDTEDFMFDTWEFHQVVYQGVIENNMGWDSDRMGIQLTWQNLNTYTPNPNIIVDQNTLYQNNIATGTDNLDAEINIDAHTTNMPWAMSFLNNLARQPLATSGGGHAVAAQAFYNTVSGTVTNTGNVMRANNSSCVATSCNSTFDAESYGGAGLLNTAANTYTDPSFANPTDLLANWTGAPDCTGFENAAECMGWNAYTLTKTPNTPIADLTPNVAYASKGYQLPSTTPSANANFPAWLKGIIYLHYAGAGSIVQRHGLVTTPVGM
jgi:hypothetical protein